jgi:hypothetical protein
MYKVALIIIYNHQYNNNIDILEKIYSDRFSDIYHLVPFYSGKKSNVIPVYENSLYFQGYIAQGYRSYFKREYTHYFFLADDLVLNPIINENNYIKYLKLDLNTSFLPELISLHKHEEWWYGIYRGYHWNINVPGVEAKGQLPDYNQALHSLKSHRLDIKPLNFVQIWEPLRRPVTRFEHHIIRKSLFLLCYLKSVLLNVKYNLSYPLVGSYSDICVVSSDVMRQFCHYCGVFAATELFVEIALPTSLVLCTNKIITEKDLELRGRLLWTNEDYKEIKKYSNSLDMLLKSFPQEYLYLHPIKLSKWNTELCRNPLS